MTRLTRLSVVAVLALATLVSGCATFKAIEPFPAQTDPVAITVSEEPPSAMSDMPIGVYQVAEGALYLSGHQQGQAAGLMFGLLGVAIVHGANQDAGRERVKDAEAALRTRLVEGTRAMLEQKLARAHGPRPIAAPGTKGRSTLEVTPYVVLSFVSDTHARPYVILRTRLLEGTEERWWTRYVVAVAEDRPVGGADGWAAEQGEPLRRAVRGGLDYGLDLMLKDVAGGLPRATGKRAKVKGQYAFVRAELELEGDVLEETPERIVFAPQVGDVVVFAGVNAFDKKSVLIGPPAPKQQ
ncbi:MAG: hypothetical protein KJ025_13210 [Burkholderiales bacterium]|nr:hypothetical protein [Burkholderiales bacterium]